MPRHKPYTVKVELVRGCTMRCSFCALTYSDWRDDPWKFMENETFSQIMDDLVEWRPKLRLEFAERGEQMLHPKLIEFAKEAREKLPKAQILLTSNGDKYKSYRGDFAEYCYGLLEAGLNIVMMDCYDQERYDLFKDLFPDAKLFYEDNWHPYRYIGPKVKEILLVDGTPGRSNRIRKFHNWAGIVPPHLAEEQGYEIRRIAGPREAMCVRPFRELEIHYDGTVPLCCIDWDSEVVIGNVHDTHLQDLWDDIDPYRRHLLKKDRAAISPCSKCSERAGFRVGFEMDWFKEEKE